MLLILLALALFPTAAVERSFVNGSAAGRVVICACGGCVGASIPLPITTTIAIAATTISASAIAAASQRAVAAAALQQRLIERRFYNGRGVQALEITLVIVGRSVFAGAFMRRLIRVFLLLALLARGRHFRVTFSLTAAALAISTAAAAVAASSSMHFLFKDSLFLLYFLYILYFYEYVVTQRRVVARPVIAGARTLQILLFICLHVLRAAIVVCFTRS